jgi:hypothetical protein
MVPFMRSFAGRVLRFLLGVVLIWWGFYADGGWLLGVIGFVPILAAVFNFCIFAPLFGYTLMGVRRQAKHA